MGGSTAKARFQQQENVLVLKPLGTGLHNGAAHLDLQVEVGGEVHLGLEHGPVLAHEVAVDGRQVVARLLVLHSGLHSGCSLSSAKLWRYFGGVRAADQPPEQSAAKSAPAGLEHDKPVLPSPDAPRGVTVFVYMLASAAGCQVCPVFSSALYEYYRGLTEFRFISQPRRVPSLSRGKPKSSSNAWLSSSCTQMKHCHGAQSGVCTSQIEILAAARPLPRQPADCEYLTNGHHLLHGF